jgi:haloalkane dehalogenase
VRGLAYLEAIVRPVTWAEWPDNARKIFQAMRSPAGEELVLDRNVFVERILPASILRRLDDAEMEAYRRPWRTPGEARRPMLTWPREIPIAGEPADVVRLVEQYGAWLATSPVPKLFVNAEPGSILVGAPREFCRAWANQREVTVKGLHFVPEDSPDEIGRAVADFVRRPG